MTRITKLQLILTVLALMLTSPLFALIWIPRKLLGRMKQTRHLAARTVPYSRSCRSRSPFSSLTG